MQIALEATLHNVQYAAMTLDEYLTANKETAEAFAKRIGRATSTITRLRKGETRPDWGTADAITAATEGKVQPNDFSQRDASAIAVQDEPPATDASHGEAA
jgi:transcriptional regulator with XRE-family HTH domain